MYFLSLRGWSDSGMEEKRESQVLSLTRSCIVSAAPALLSLHKQKDNRASFPWRCSPSAFYHMPKNPSAFCHRTILSIWCYRTTNTGEAQAIQALEAISVTYLPFVWLTSTALSAWQLAIQDGLQSLQGSLCSKQDREGNWAASLSAPQWCLHTHSKYQQYRFQIEMEVGGKHK